MMPASAVSALVFANPCAEYIAIDKICRDQVRAVVFASSCRCCVGIVTVPLPPLPLPLPPTIQIEDYAARKAMPVEEVEVWLQSSLGYIRDADKADSRDEKK